MNRQCYTDLAQLIKDHLVMESCLDIKSQKREFIRLLAVFFGVDEEQFLKDCGVEE